MGLVPLFKMWQLMLVVSVAWLCAGADLPPSCNRPVYCNSKLLHHVQTVEPKIYNDSKAFVDLEMTYDENKTLSDFEQLLNDTNQSPTRDQIKQFVDEHFSDVGELEKWVPTDFSDDPQFVNNIKDEELKKFGKDLNSIWPIISRKVKDVVNQEPERFSIIPLTHGFIIPGGRFKEIYYWDTYWIVEGLLISDMATTAKGVIQNLIELLNRFGHIPNGSRWYYQERSQPPMLAAMMALYYEYTKDIDFIRDNIAALETEIEYWLSSKKIAVEKDNQTYDLLRYYAPSSGPRPESYREDYNNANKLNESLREDFYTDIKSAAESGWDFSARWFITDGGSNAGTLVNIHTKYIVPVDLNAIFAGLLQKVANFHVLLKNTQKALGYGLLAEQWRNSIYAVLWNEEDGIWYDYDTKDKVHRKYFYTSNFAPLWQGAVNTELIKINGHRVVQYLKNSSSLNFLGGIPTSLNNTGEQWDFPNVWPPEVSIVVNAMDAINTEESRALAIEVAQTFVRSCHAGFSEYKQMFEKYDASRPGQFGGGGEYNVQSGFGWSNGAVMEFLHKYGSVLTAKDTLPNGSKN